MEMTVRELRDRLNGLIDADSAARDLEVDIGGLSDIEPVADVREYRGDKGDLRVMIDRARATIGGARY